MLKELGALTFLWLAAAPAQSPTSWLDRPLVNWNTSRRIPVARGKGIEPRCKGSVRTAASPEDKAVEKAGWTLYSAEQRFAGTTIISAESGNDGMCRPLGYNYFVFNKGQFVGTISPTPMDSRTDGAATVVHLGQELELTAEFERYSPSDPLCCPSRISHVTYRIATEGKGPVLVPEMVYTRLAK